MTKFFLKIFDFLAGKRWLAAIIAVAIAAGCGLFATRLDYEEDIAKFLPGEEESKKYSEAYDDLGKKNNIVLIFTHIAKDDERRSCGKNGKLIGRIGGVAGGKDDRMIGRIGGVAGGKNGEDGLAVGGEDYEYVIEDAMDAFGEKFARIDSANMVAERQIRVDGEKAAAMMDAVMENYPLFLTESDYRRIDSLLNIPDFIITQLGADKLALLFPTGDALMRNLQGDPLHLFTPVLQRLRASSANDNYMIADDYMFLKGNNTLGSATSTTAGDADDKAAGTAAGNANEEAAGTAAGDADDEAAGTAAGNANEEAAGTAAGNADDEAAGTAAGNANEEAAGTAAGDAGNEAAGGVSQVADPMRGIAFLTSPFGTSESGMNAKVAAMVQEAIDSTEAEHPDIQITAVGSPLIAAGNATQIKKDSILAISLAMILIGLLLVLTYRRFSDIFWIIASTLFGWLIALGAMSLIRHSMSMIVLGVASVIIGIAVNYPLHFMDGLKTGISPRQNLREMIEPLLIGNITTIAAFLCLVFLNAAAMQDMGLFASMMLAGTIVFVLIFLPVFVRRRNAGTKTVELGRVLPDKVPSSGWLFVAVIAATIVFGFFSTRTKFDSDMQKINFMTKEQKEALALLEPHGEYRMMYAMAEGATLEKALERNDELRQRIAKLGDSVMVKGAGNMLPSLKEQSRRIERWNAFWGRGKAEKLSEELRAESVRAGFSENAFDPFLNLLNSAPVPQAITVDSPLAAAFDGTYVLSGSNGYRIANQIYYENPEFRQDIKDAAGGNGALVFDSSDISSRLASVLSENFDFIGIVCSLAVFIFLCLSFRRLCLSLLAFIPLAVSWFWILGIMGIFDIRFNIVNIILATFIFGQGDDYTIFMTEAMIYEYAYGKKRLSTYKNSIFNSALIMFIGIGALVLAKHPAMRSLGIVTVIGMFVVVVMAYYLPPVIFSWLTLRQGAKRDVPITLGRLARSLYSISAFALIMFLFVYPYTFFHFLLRKGEDAAEGYHLFISRLSRFIVMRIPGVRFTMENPFGTTFDRPSIIIANHQSHFDAICLLLMHPKLVFATNDWVWNNPLYGYLLHKAECYPIAEGLEKNMDKIRSLVARGYSIIVFPEGTRTLDGSIMRFHKGAFYVSQALGLDIVPVCLHGANHVLPKSDFMLRKGAIHLQIGRRMPPATDYHKAAKTFRHAMINEYEALRKRLETPEYFASYVMSKYLYKGADIEKRARQALDAAGSVEYLQNADSPDKFEIRNCGIGVYSLIYALMHPQTEVYASDPSEENLAIASHCSSLPKNLHYES